MLTSVFLAVVFAAAPAEPGTQDHAASQAKPARPPLVLFAVEKRVIERTNKERTRRGLKPLKVDEDLVRSARKHAIWMAKNTTLRHTTRPVAENIAMGQRSAAEALSSWMGSPGHRANILGRRYRRIGVAAYACRDGRIFWCQQFR